MDLGFLHIDDRFDRLAHCVDGEVQSVAAPLLIDMGCAAGDMIAELVKIAGDPAPGFFAAEFMRQVDVDWSLHG